MPYFVVVGDPGAQVHVNLDAVTTVQETAADPHRVQVKFLDGRTWELEGPQASMLVRAIERFQRIQYGHVESQRRQMRLESTE